MHGSGIDNLPGFGIVLESKTARPLGLGLGEA
jgi:hypothetical protein